MNSVVLYTSHFGNTRMIAEAIGSGLRTQGAVRLVAIEDAPARLLAGTDLVLIGGPTEQHGMTAPLIQFFARLEPGSLAGVPAVAFDTRLRWPRWLSGSAGASIAHKLRAAGAQLIAPEESFFITGAMGTGGRDTAELDGGELERAAEWAVSLGESMRARELAAAR